MKVLFSFVTAMFTLSMPLHAMPTAAGLSQVETAHGGGCRKSSPPGECCHMDNSLGRVHCH
ncbi:hypothetical protein B6V74_09525 [Thioclava sp. F42-5]|nr:hypothetical protein B6V74_09525 [Thioclava sp. F42-5]